MRALYRFAGSDSGSYYFAEFRCVARWHGIRPQGGFAALGLYLAEGAMGLPVFNPLGPGGIAQILGPTGGYLMAYPFVAYLAGLIMERGEKTFLRGLTAGFLAEILLFVGGLSWLYVLTHSLTMAMKFGLYWFVIAEVLKIASAAGIVAGWRRFSVKL